MNLEPFTKRFFLKTFSKRFDCWEVVCGKMEKLFSGFCLNPSKIFPQNCENGKFIKEKNIFSTKSVLTHKSANKLTGRSWYKSLEDVVILVSKYKMNMATANWCLSVKLVQKASKNESVRLLSQKNGILRVFGSARCGLSL